MRTDSLAAAIAIVVSGQVLYHAVARGVGTDRSAFNVVAVAYMVSLLMVLAIGAAGGQITRPLDGGTIWRGACLGVAVACVELGYVYAYRRGLPVTTGAISVLTMTTIVLIPIGLLGFGETVTLRNAIGVVLAVVGIWLIRA